MTPRLLTRWTESGCCDRVKGKDRASGKIFHFSGAEGRKKSRFTVLGAKQQILPSCSFQSRKINMYYSSSESVLISPLVQKHCFYYTLNHWNVPKSWKIKTMCGTVGHRGVGGSYVHIKKASSSLLVEFQGNERLLLPTEKDGASWMILHAVLCALSAIPHINTHNSQDSQQKRK